MTEMKKKIVLSILTSILTIVIYLSFKLRNDEIFAIKNNHIEVVGMVSHVGLKTTTISYSINGIAHSYTQNIPYLGLTIGEEFYTLASTKNLDRALVFFSNPILDSVKYQFSDVLPLEVDKLVIDDSELSFRYRVGVKEYNRIQKFETGKRPHYLHVLKVRYRLDRPEIGYLVSG